MSYALSAVPEPAARLRGLWAHRDFVKLWSGQTISELGSRITREGIPLTAVLVLHAGTVQMGFLSALGGAAVLVFGLVAGVWVDRLRRRPILIVADLGRAAILVTVPAAAVAGVLSMGQLYAVAALAGILTVFFDVAYQAYLLARGIWPVGSLIGGILAAALGVRATLVLAATGVALSTLWLLASPLRRLR